MFCDIFNARLGYVKKIYFPNNLNSYYLGFTIDDYSLWPGYIPFLLLVGAFIGACSGSVGGGLKSWRVLIILDQARQEIIKTIHPNAVVTSRIGKKVVDASISEKVWGFFAVYVITFIVLLVLVLMSGLDFESSFSAVGATLTTWDQDWAKFHQTMNHFQALQKLFYL